MDVNASASNSSINKHKKLSFIQLVIVIFTLTCAGPFGIEESIQSGGILYTLIGLIVLPIVYSIPQSLMCSELGSLMPSHHGYIIWVYRGFEKDGKIGNFLGFYNAVGCTIGMAKDIPIYIILMLFYFKKLLFNDYAFQFTFFEEYLLSLLIIIIGALFNIANITTLGNTTIIFTIITLIPFIIGFLYSLPKTDVSSWMDTEPQNDNNEYQFGLFLATMLWLHTGWDSTGCLSAEIRFNKSKFFRAFVFGMLLSYFTYTVSVIGALTVPCNNDNTSGSDTRCWDDGYLYTAYEQILPGLGVAVTLAGFISNFSLYIAEMSVQSRTFWALAQPNVLLTDNGTMYVESYDGIIYNDNMEIINKNTIKDDIKRIIHIGLLPNWLCGTIWNKTGAPVRGVILQSLICCVLVLFDFEFLLQATVLINCITWCAELISFLRLRYTEPNTYRPYKVPGGMFVAWLITIDKIILVVILFILVIKDHPYYIFVTIGSIIITVIWYYIYNKCNININKKRQNENMLSYEMVTTKNSSSISSGGDNV